MAKKKQIVKPPVMQTVKQPEKQRARQVVKSSEHSPATDDRSEIAESQPAAAEPAGDSIVSEVQSFLNRRSELAKKLAEEIEATERKLAELKKTASLLNPSATPVGGMKDRKLKKVKKPASRAEKTDVEPAAEETATPAAPEE